MGKIILNDIEYGIGVSNGSNVDTTNLVEKDSIITAIDDTCTDEQLASALATKTYVDNKVMDIDTTNLVEKDSIVTVIDENVTDEQIPSALATKTYVDNKVMDIDTTNLVEKDSIVTTIDDTCTDEQVPSAKAVYDKLSDLPVDSNVTKDTLSLITNSQFFTISITKNNANWYGNLKFSYVYATSPTEVDITITDTLSYTVSKGTNTINKITYTVDGANLTIGINCTATMYGTQTVEMPSEFGTINSLTKQEFTGANTATLNVSTTKNTYRIITQDKAGYFKFKPCSNPTLQGIRITATDNYGGMIDISGVTPNQTQYKPFKCVRLSHGTYTDYSASNPTNNKMEKLFYFDGYMYLKISSYTTATFTGLVGEPTFVETIDATAEEIPIVSAIATQYDGYGDPYIISIGDSVSGDGSIQTLASLGFSNDILTWKNGIYKVSHVSGLINLPSDITNASPGFRLEHHNIKKWNANHNPSYQTWGQRHSVFYADNGNVYHRFYESGTTVGTYIKDTGWQKIAIDDKSKATLVTNTATLKLDVTKKNASWYGVYKISYMYAGSLCEMEIATRGTNDVNWSIITGKSYVNKVTYTQNGVNYVFGIEFSGTVYGIQQVEVIGDFADINSLTKDAFTGTNTATRWYADGKTNGVTLLDDVAELGLTSPCTTVQIVKVMRSKANVAPASAVKGIFNNENKTISDAPTSYGLLEISAYGNDRLMIRYDGISGSNHDGSYVGKIKASAVGVFSGIEWERIDGSGWITGDVGDPAVYSTGEQIVGTWADGKPIYRITIIRASHSVNQQLISGVDTFIRGYGTCKRGGYVYNVPHCGLLQGHLSDTTFTYLNFLLDDSTGNLRTIGSSSYDITDLKVTLEYTKR